MRLKFKEQLCVMTLKSHEKFEGEQAYHFKTGLRNLMNFDRITQKSQKFALWAPFDKSI